VPMRIYPALHYTMGGLWVDYNLMNNLPGLFVLGEANFSDHGANRLGASALMQGLVDGYFVIPYTIGNYLASTALPPVASTRRAPFVRSRTLRRSLRRSLWSSEARPRTRVSRIVPRRASRLSPVAACRVPGSARRRRRALTRPGPFGAGGAHRGRSPARAGRDSA